MSSGTTIKEIQSFFEYLRQSKTNNEMTIIITNDMCKDLQDMIENLYNYNELLQQENKQLKEENARLNLKPLEGIFAQVDDDMLLRSCGAMQQEVDNYKSILTELENLLKEKFEAIRTLKEMLGDDVKILNPDIKGIEMGYKDIQDKIQELKEKYK